MNRLYKMINSWYFFLNSLIMFGRLSQKISKCLCLKRTLTNCLISCQTCTSSNNPIYDPWFRWSTRGQEPRTKTGGRYTVSVIPGAGLGKELMEYVIDVFECCGAPVDVEWISHYEKEFEFKNMVLSVKRNGIGIKGNIEHKRPGQFAGGSGVSRNVQFRKVLDLYINVVEFKSFASLRENVKIKKDIDIVMMRGNNEAEYVLLEHSSIKNVVEHLKVITAYNAKRVAHYAFQYALTTRRKHITVVYNHEATPICEGLFSNTVLEVGKQYPKIEVNVISQDRIIQTIMKTPEAVDIIVCNGLIGSLLTAMLHGLIGGDPLSAMGDVSEKYAVFQPSGRSRGTSLVGQGIANPTAFLLAGIAALNALGASMHAKYIHDSLAETFSAGVKTKDIGGTATTKEFVREVIDNIKTKVPGILCKYDMDQRVNNK